MDDAKNEAAVGGKAAEIQADDSRIKILVIPTDEELSIAQQVGFTMSFALNLIRLLLCQSTDAKDRHSHVVDRLLHCSADARGGWQSQARGMMLAHGTVCSSLEM